MHTEWSTLKCILRIQIKGLQRRFQTPLDLPHGHPYLQPPSLVVTRWGCILERQIDKHPSLCCTNLCNKLTHVYEEVRRAQAVDPVAMQPAPPRVGFTLLYFGCISAFSGLKDYKNSIQCQFDAVLTCSKQSYVHSFCLIQTKQSLSCLGLSQCLKT